MGAATVVDLLGRTSLQRAGAPFGSSCGLPAAAYTSTEVLSWERAHFFAPSWSCAGRAGRRKRSPRQQEAGGWAFVQTDEGGIAFDEQCGNLWEILAPYEPERQVVAARHGYEVRANWKFIHENYQECYHCSEIHPELCRVTPPDSGYSYDMKGLFVAGPMDLRPDAETMSLDGRSHSSPLRGLVGRQLREVGYIGVFPDLLISPHPDYILTHRLQPLTPDSTYVECEWLFPPEAVHEPGFSPDYAVEFWDITNREDWEAVESLQRSAAGRGYRPGPLSVSWEAGPYMWVKMLADGYLEGAVKRPPPVPGIAHVPRYETFGANSAR
ncbi:MAG: glycine betaine catabolism [Actinomycetota bacterium]|jgi:Rieske 2Fe-2S family protein|nr:glycine betaine catabolism [Actinomycetota bacterium]